MIWGLAALAALLAAVSIGAWKWRARRKAAVVSAWSSTVAVATVFVLGYGKAQAAIAPALWEPRALPADWPVTAFAFLVSGWLVASLVWAIAVSRARPRSTPPPPTQPPPWPSNFVAPSRTGTVRPRVRYRVVTGHRSRR